MTEDIRQKNIFDVLQSSARTSIDMQRMCKKLLSLLSEKEYFYALSFEQQMILVQTIIGAESANNKFMIDFFKANSRSPESMMKALEKLLIVDPGSKVALETDSSQSTEVIPTKRVKQLRTTLLEELDRRTGIEREVKDV